MRMVQDDVIRFMKSVAESPALADKGGYDVMSWSSDEAFDEGMQEANTLLARKLLQMMGVSYNASSD